MPKRKPKRPQTRPGQPGADTGRMIRVDHAGEFGAQRIYAGQIAVLGRGKTGPVLRHMAAQEERHLQAFERLIRERGVRPTALHPLWHLLGYALGAGTAALGEKAAMACTVAVEEVIDEHYGRQLAALGKTDPELAALIKKFRAEEVEHKNIGLDHEAEQLPYYRLLRAAVRRASQTAIWLSERV